MRSPHFLKSHSFWVLIASVTGLKLDEAWRAKALSLLEASSQISPTQGLIALLVIAYLGKRGLVEAAAVKTHSETKGVTRRIEHTVKNLHRDLEARMEERIREQLAQASAKYAPSAYSGAQPTPKPDPQGDETLGRGSRPIPSNPAPRPDPAPLDDPSPYAPPLPGRRRIPLRDLPPKGKPIAPTPREHPRPDERERTLEALAEIDPPTGIHDEGPTWPKIQPDDNTLTKGHFLP